MSLLYKPDWEETRERYKAWWTHEDFGRCMIQVTAPRADAPQDPPPRPTSMEEKWFGKEYLAAINDWGMSRTFYGGEAFPNWNFGYPGWQFLPCSMGAHITLDMTTGWVEPIIQEGELTDHDYRNVKIDPDSKWWLLSQEMLHFAAEQAAGKSIPGLGAFGGCGDTLAALRGNAQLLIDLMDCPDYVREFDMYLMEMWMEVHDTYYQIAKEAAGGSTCWFPLWSPGRFYSSHNDFAYMISPKSFEECFIPSLEMQTNYLDHTVHHVDGVGNFAHVGALCELPRLQAFQILPGAGKPSPLHYMDILKKVQAKGKNLHISIGANEVETALGELSSRGLCIETWCASEQEARDLIKKCEVWSRDRLH